LKGGFYTVFRRCGLVVEKNYFTNKLLTPEVSNKTKKAAYLLINSLFKSSVKMLT
jgi:hypothetical protein